MIQELFVSIFRDVGTEEKVGLSSTSGILWVVDPHTLGVSGTVGRGIHTSQQAEENDEAGSHGTIDHSKNCDSLAQTIDYTMLKKPRSPEVVYRLTPLTDQSEST